MQNKMRKYKFLLKPFFFIFNLLFATWLVFQIEKLSPSDFGKYKYIFEDAPQSDSTHLKSKEYLKKICIDYKTGILDSAAFDKQIDKFMAGQKIIFKK